MSINIQQPIILDVIFTLFSTIHKKCPSIESHSRRVSRLCQEIGLAMNLNKTDINELVTCGLIHDVGKIGIENSILQKKGALTEREWEEIKSHAEMGYRILNAFPGMSDIANYVLSHHERPDGKGYPRGITKEEIPFVSRVLAVADSYDAMTAERTYKKALSKTEAIAELEKNKGTQFDPDIVDIFIKKVLFFGIDDVV